MSTSDPLNSLDPRIRDLLKERPGATFLRADLQVHTPLDKAFPDKPAPTDGAARVELATRYLKAAKDRGIDVVGITEHNDVSWIDELRAAAATLDMHLFPGFEVESKEGVHVLCLFDPQTPVTRLEEVLIQLGLTAEDRRTRRLELRTHFDFQELLPFVQSPACGGMCIAAHIETAKGLLSALREGARVDAWKTPALLAAQISKPPEDITSGNGRIVRGEDPIYRRDRLPGYVLTSDARSFDAIGSKSIWIKMDEVGVEGLRQAFLDPGSRIAYSDPSERREGAHLLAVAWEGDFLDGVSFPVNPQLNALIGGKGTGKSTVIETIRYAFGLDYHTDEASAAGEALLDNAFRSGSKVSVVVETDAPARTRYLVERTAPHAAVVRDEDGSPRPELEASSLIGLSVYGQKEVFGIAQNAEARLEMLDGFAEDELRDALARERELQDALGENSQLILDALKRIHESEEQLSELPNLEEWRKRFRKAGFDELLKERRDLEREERVLDKASASLAARRRSLADIEAEPFVGDFDIEVAEMPNTDLLEAARSALSETDDEWTRSLADLQATLQRAVGVLADLKQKWQARKNARQSHFDEALRELQERMPDVDPERYLDVERRIEQLKPLKEVLGQLRTRLKDARTERERLLIELADARGEKHRARQRAASRLNDALRGNVEVSLVYQGERRNLVSRLAGLKSGARSDALKRMVNDARFTVAEFADRTRAGTLAGYCGLTEGQAMALQKALEESDLLEIERVELPDHVELKLDVAPASEKSEYRPLDKLSPGQRSTAILLLVMQESKDPLLIDQPEDDLDNRFVYDDIVKRLREAKQARQFLIATHNANIPILGDAEQIVALDARERDGGNVRSEVTAAGSIDAEIVRNSAEHILEGGREAFEFRRRKYSP